MALGMVQDDARCSFPLTAKKHGQKSRLTGKNSLCFAGSSSCRDACSGTVGFDTSPQDWRQTVKGNEPRRNAKTAKYLIFLCFLAARGYPKSVVLDLRRTLCHALRRCFPLKNGHIRESARQSVRRRFPAAPFRIGSSNGGVENDEPLMKMRAMGWFRRKCLRDPARIP